METKTDDLDKFKIPGFEVEMKNRKKYIRKSGGIVLIYRENLEDRIDTKIETESQFILWFKLKQNIPGTDDIYFQLAFLYTTRKK